MKLQKLDMFLRTKKPKTLLSWKTPFGLKNPFRKPFCPRESLSFGKAFCLQEFLSFGKPLCLQGSLSFGKPFCPRESLSFEKPFCLEEPSPSKRNWITHRLLLKGFFCFVKRIRGTLTGCAKAWKAEPHVICHGAVYVKINLNFRYSSIIWIEERKSKYKRKLTKKINFKKESSWVRFRWLFSVSEDLLISLVNLTKN